MNNTFASAVPRGLEACVFCAVRDYLEHRYEVFLYKEATGMTTMTKFNYHKTRDPMTEGGKEVDAQTATHGLLVHGRTFCLGPAEKIDALLGVQHYSKLWPIFPNTSSMHLQYVIPGIPRCIGCFILDESQKMFPTASTAKFFQAVSRKKIKFATLAGIV